MTKLKQSVEFISEENFKIIFSDYIEKYEKLIQEKKLNFYPSTIKNEVREYINSKLFVHIILLRIYAFQD
jgi:hypothetical protein